MARLIVKRGRAKPLWYGHPWVYAQAVERVEGSYEPGGVVDVIDPSGAFIGRALANPRSSIVARILSRDPNEHIDRELLRRRLAAALAVRARLGLPGQGTDAYRLVNSEGDGLPGLVVDVYGKSLAVQFTALGLYRLADAIVTLLRELLEPERIVQIGAGAYAQTEGIPATTHLLHGEGGEVVVSENGVRYGVDLLGGQKTGLYCDQRLNRALVASLSRGQRVLDCYSYVGGFALNALHGGALEVTAVDASGRAVAAAQRNAELNGVALPVVEADVFRYLAEVPRGSVDLTIVDPPKFARSRRELDAALKGHRKLHRAALRTVRDGGLLASACCSQLVTVDELRRTLAAAALDERRRVRLLQVLGAGPDHPTLPGFPEGEYLKFLLCEVTS
ncbi:MAG: class I SAM-dependent rRNA methyltransferase [Deltaproteobacteria bacterium]|nr:class I SAM-dependent rRNA methyltransferase [Deltaproteobacteria bacterium]